MNSRNRKTQPSHDTLGCSASPAREMTEAAWRKAQELSIANDKKQIGATIAVLGPSFAFQVEQLQAQITTAMQIQGFWSGEDNRNTGSKIALMHSELSEALEADRKSIEQDDKVPEFTGIEAELADTVIRILDFAGYHNLRLDEAIVAKMLFNLTREYRHGKKY